MVDLLPAAQTSAPGQVIRPQTASSPLAQAMMGQQSAAPQSGGASAVPLSSMMQALAKSDPEAFKRLWQGFGNWMDGNSFDGMAAGSNLSGLASQAAGNIAGGAAI